MSCPKHTQGYLFSDSDRPCGLCLRRSKRRRASRALMEGDTERWRQITRERIEPGEFDGL